MTILREEVLSSISSGGLPSDMSESSRLFIASRGRIRSMKSRGTNAWHRGTRSWACRGESNSIILSQKLLTPQSFIQQRMSFKLGSSTVNDAMPPTQKPKSASQLARTKPSRSCCSRKSFNGTWETTSVGAYLCLQVLSPKIRTAMRRPTAWGHVQRMLEKRLASQNASGCP